MSNLIQLLKKSFSGKSICQIDLLENGRHGYIFSGFNTERKAIKSLIEGWDEGKITLYELETRLLDYNVEIIKNSLDFPDYYSSAWDKEINYDCRDWTFDTIMMPKYTYREGLRKANTLLFEDLPEIEWIPKPETGAIVAYSKKSNIDSDAHVSHWGLVAELNEKIIVHSKWGEGHLYSHPLELTVPEYGNVVYFFMPHVKTNKNNKRNHFL